MDFSVRAQSERPHNLDAHCRRTYDSHLRERVALRDAIGHLQKGTAFLFVLHPCLQVARGHEMQINRELETGSGFPQ